MKIRHEAGNKIIVEKKPKEVLSCKLCRTVDSKEWYWWNNPYRGGLTCLDCAYGYNTVNLYPGDEEYDFSYVDEIKEVQP